MSSVRASAMTVAARGLAARCPACGRGRVFRRGVQSERECGVCGWRFERCPGHWIGGNEINLLATFPAGVVAFALAAPVFGLGPLSATIAVVVAGAFSVAFYRPSRGLFFALDYLIDSAPDAPPLPPRLDDDGGPRDDDDPLGDGPASSPRPRLAVVPAGADAHPAPGSYESFTAPPGARPPVTTGEPAAR